MSNFLESASNNSSELENNILGPKYSYTTHIKTPDELGMSGDGNSIATNVNSLNSYSQLLFSGGGNASKVNGPLGKQMFMITAAKCKDIKSNQQVSRSLYINTIPVEYNVITNSMKSLFGKSQGLVPGILNNITNMNPMAIFGAFKQGPNPDCMAVELPTRNENNVESSETGYLIIDDVKNLSPCLFPNKINPVSNKQGNSSLCIEGFQNINNENNNNIIKILDFLMSEKNKEILDTSNLIAYSYIISLIFLIIYISIYTKK